MNPTKRTLIVAAGIFNLISAAIGIIGIILACTQIETLAQILQSGGATLTKAEITLIYSLALGVSIGELALGVIAGSLLLISTRNKGIHFEKNKWVFWAGFILTVIMGFTSIAAILLYISFGYNNYAVSEFKEERANRTYSDYDGTVFEETPAGNFSASANKEEGIKSKIDQLRELRDNGEITEEEFKKMLMKLF